MPASFSRTNANVIIAPLHRVSIRFRSKELFAAQCTNYNSNNIANAQSTQRRCQQCERFLRCFECRWIAIPRVANSYIFFSRALIDSDIHASVSDPNERVNDEAFRSPPTGWEALTINKNEDWLEQLAATASQIRINRFLCQEDE